MRRLVAAMLLGVAVYGAFAAYTGYSEIAASLSSFSWLSFVAACCLAFANYMLRFLKWEYYLARLQIRDIPKRDSLLIFLSGFVLTVTPGKVGEVFKSLLLFNTYGVPVQRTAPIVIAERLTDIIGITVLIIVGVQGLAIQGSLFWAGIGAGLVVTCLVVIMSRTLSELCIRTIERLPGPFRRIGPKLRESWDSLRVMTTPQALLVPTALSVGAWALEGIALYVILWGFSASVPAASALFFYSTATLAGAVIPVPGGLGVTEGALNGQLRLMGGVSQGVATASMILVRFATLWFAVLVGFSALGLLRARHPSLKPKVGAAAQQSA
jgi:glycosyltransferase 2 family protein